MQQILRVITRKPRFSISISQDLCEWLDELAEAEGKPRPKIIERIVRERRDRPAHAITVELSPEAVDKLKQLAAKDMRVLEAHVAWVLLQYLEKTEI